MYDLSLFFQFLFYYLWLFSPQVPIYGLHLYDSVTIYAQALTEVLQMGGDIYDGRLVMSRIFNRSYHSIQGFDVGLHWLCILLIFNNNIFIVYICWYTNVKFLLMFLCYAYIFMVKYIYVYIYYTFLFTLVEWLCYFFLFWYCNVLITQWLGLSIFAYIYTTFPKILKYFIYLFFARKQIKKYMKIIKNLIFCWGYKTTKKNLNLIYK